MKNLKTIFIVSLLLAILNFNIVFASNNYNFNVYDASSNQDLTNVNGLFYNCNINGCADNVEPNRFNEINSGGSNALSTSFLGTSSPQDYLSVFLSECYLPTAGLTYGDWGTGQNYNYDVYMSKGQNCHAPIYSYNVLNSVHVNEPLQVDVVSTLDAKTASAFGRTGFPPLFTPIGYEDYFSAETFVTLEIYNSANQLVNLQTQIMNIPADGKSRVHFEWTPSVSGNYTAKIKTEITDCQCESGTQESVQSSFTVLQDEPVSECYTIINNLHSSNSFPFVNEQVTLSLDKTSNYANNLGALFPVRTSLTWTITNTDTNEISTLNTQDSANPDSLNPKETQAVWMPNKAGHYMIRVDAASNDASCTGTNSPMSTQMTLTVKENPVTCTDIDGDGYSQEGGSCGPRDCADTNANINLGAAEVCNSVDDNCDGRIDEGFGLSSSCSIGIGACIRTGITVCTANGLQAQCSVVPGIPLAEICNNIDDNCDGIVDNNLPITCSSNNQCNDNNVLTNDVCNNAGTCGSSCSHTPITITCSSNNDCNDNNILTTDVCNNPGTASSSCSHTVNNVSVICTNGQTQNQICGVSSVGSCRLGVQTSVCLANNSWGAFGACVGDVNPASEVCNSIDDNCNGVVDDGLAVVCFNNAQCDDNNVLTIDVCNFATTCLSSCTHAVIPVTPVCSLNTDCNDNNALTNDICNSPGTAASSCSHTPVVIVCSSNVDCNDNNASTNDVCNNPGTAISVCSYTFIPPAILNFGISANPTFGQAPLQVFFYSNIISGNAPYSYYWDFSDGVTSTIQNPIHVFYDEKLYTVSLRVTDSRGNVVTSSILIDTRKKDLTLTSRNSAFITSFDIMSNKIHPGDTFAVNTGIENIAGKKLTDATITVSIPELGITANAKTGTLKNSETTDSTLYLTIPSWTQQGYYNVRLSFTANSGQVRRVEYRQIKVI